MLQSEAGYINARPRLPDRGNLLQCTAGPYIRVIHVDSAMSVACPLCLQLPTFERTSVFDAMCRLCCKSLWAARRKILIQDQARTRNNDSKEPACRFDCFKFQFHRARSATFATQSARTGSWVIGQINSLSSDAGRLDD